MCVSENGGSPETLIEIKSEEAFFSPQLLPDGNSVMYTLDTGGKYQIAVQSFGSDDRKILLDGATARYLPTGHLVYLVGNDLKAVSFDIDKLRLTGDAVTIIEDILVYGPPHFFISSSGTFAYLSNISTQRSLVWVDFEGKEEKLSTPPDFYLYPKVSPDGTRVALAIADSAGNQGIAIWNIMRGVMNRFPYSNAMNFYPHWASNGRDIVFGHMRGSNIGIYRMPSDGTGILEPLYIEAGRQIYPTSLSGSGNILLCQIQQIGIPIQDIGMLSMEENQEWKLLLQEDYVEAQPQISPDEKWIAYKSNQSGKNEIYVRSFPDVDKGQEQISTNGGDSPLWSPDGQELYYLNGDNVMAVTVETEPDFMPGKPRTLFQGAYYSEAPDWNWMGWDIHPDGKRFLMMTEADPESTEEPTRPKINIVLNWFEELKERVPVD